MNNTNNATSVSCCKDMCSFFLGLYLGVEFLNHMLILFNFLRNRWTVLHSKGTILHSHQQSRRDLVSLHPRGYLFLSVF